jgi:hypothetical protein
MLEGAFADDSCFYRDERGVIHTAHSREQVPEQFREVSQCQKVAPSRISADRVTVSGNVRAVDMATPLGRVLLRWPRALEKLFSRTPERAMLDAMKTVSKAVRSGGFPAQVATLDMEWRIVFLDQDLPEVQIPPQVVSNCHPGWMYPPADIFIVAQRVAAGCSGTSVDKSQADRALAQVLVHEIGHAIEFALLKGFGADDGVRAEGFARWFEGFAGRYSGLINSSATIDGYKQEALLAFQSGARGFSFSGISSDYAVGAIYFRLLELKRGVPGIMQLYSQELIRGGRFVDTVRKQFAWSDERWIKEFKGIE